jgi:apolipoprotein N-acyltransferase
VLPEKLALLDSEGAGRAAQDVAMTARATGAVVIAGAEVRERGTYYNRALLAAPDGRVVWYDKQRLVPGWEARITPGDAPVFVDIAGTRLGIAICKDMHVPEIGRQYAGGATIMVVPAYDFGRDAWMGARMTALRAVENGYAVARSARNGFVSAYDRTGRILVERPVTDDMTVATAPLSTHGAATFYGRNGDVFGWGCVCLAVLLRVWLGWGGLLSLSSSKLAALSLAALVFSTTRPSTASRRDKAAAAEASDAGTGDRLNPGGRGGGSNAEEHNVEEEILDPHERKWASRKGEAA